MKLPRARRAGLSRSSLVILFGVMAALLAVGYVGGDDDERAADSQRAPELRGNLLPRALTARPAPTFRLRDARGGYVDSRSLAGRPFALTFLYTRCPDVCPIIGQEIKKALELLGRRSGAVTVLAVSIDPDGDSADAARRWLARQRVPSNFRYLVGTRSQLKPVWRRFYAAPQLPGRPETSTHSASVWLLDADGRVRTKYSAGLRFDPADLAHDFRVLLQEARS